MRGKSKTALKPRLFGIVLVALAAVGLMQVPATPVGRSDPFLRTGFDGSGEASMQSVTLPARIGRVATTPDGSETWGIAVSDGRLSGWDSRSPIGQVVFMRHSGKQTWEIVGPPLDSNGAIFNPALASFDLAGGEGWAVGDAGVIIRKAPGQREWRESSVAEGAWRGLNVSQARLNSVSLVESGGVVGYAVGAADGKTLILRYVDGQWSADDTGTSIVADGSLELSAVTTVSRDEAWAITGSTSRDLKVYRRTSAGWSSVTPDKDPQYPMFGGPRPDTLVIGGGARMPNGGFNAAAFGGAVAAAPGGAWIGGRMFPSDAANPSGDARLTGDESRPFVLFIANDGNVTSYCPDAYGLTKQAEGQSDPTVICDGPFPLTTLDVTSLDVLPQGEVFAGGLGLFHFKDGGWSREPNTNGYLISVAFSSPTEGWAATTGNFYGAGGVVGTTENTIGHWTARAETPGAAEWPLATRLVIHSVAVAPDRSGRVLAVGEKGLTAAYSSDVGWDISGRSGLEALHGVAWSSSSQAWAVGASGKILRLDGRGWTTWADPGQLTNLQLYDVAFSSESNGVTVGAGGAAFHWNGASWTPESAPTDQPLLAVASKAGAYFAVGGKGVFLERIGGRWIKDESVSQMLQRGDRVPELHALAVASDGTVVIGGAMGSLLVRPPGGKFSRMNPPLDGNILALDAEATATGLRIFASVDPNRSIAASKFDGDSTSATRSVVMMFDGKSWRDLSLHRARTVFPSAAESGRFVPALLDLEMDSANGGWAGGGIPAGKPDSDHPVRSDSVTSVVRFQAVGDPRPIFQQASVALPRDGINFAFFGETWCQKGICSLALGSGTQGDLVATQIRNQINAAASLPNGPKFVIFAGNGRATGIPEELGQAGGYLRGFKRPVYGAVGSKDLFGGISGTFLGDLLRGGQEFTGTTPTGSPDYWKKAFDAEAAPWGSGPSPSNISTVVCPTCADPLPGLARTHYAFDYKQGGRALFRVVVIDSSKRSYGQLQEQNPQENQSDFLSAVLAQASSAAIPTIVAMNQPTILPDSSLVPSSNWTTDKTTFESTVVVNRVSAVLAGGLRWNVSGGYPAGPAPAVPLYVMGGGGAPLGYERLTDATGEASKLPTDGYYNGWLLLNIDPDAPSGLGLPGQAKVTVHPYPILDHLSVSADTHRQAAGNVIRVNALGRSLSGGFTDPDQSKATHIPLGFSTLGLCPDDGQGRGACVSRNQLAPPYRFYSEDPTVADFVVPDLRRGAAVPLRDAANRIVRDPSGKYGVLCTFKLGSTFLNAESGFYRARTKISVGPGFGPCVDAPVLDPSQPPPSGVPGVPSQEAAVSHFRPPPFQTPQNPPVILPAAPGPIAAPAPPASAAGSRKEEKEVELEREGQEDSGAQFRALPSRAHKAESLDAWVWLATMATALTLMSLVLGVAVVRQSQPPVQARVRW